ncbi:hypothetical protein B5P43_00010 [Bacillus sp. SRB_336]|nr:hypothetical protein B5P43_00010 [Bacillus sp. SRB_336]
MDAFDKSGWQRFAEVCREDFSRCTFQEQLVHECGELQDVAWAVFHRLLDRSVGWLHHQVPALGGEVPAALLSSGRADEVRRCLWRMP